MNKKYLQQILPPRQLEICELLITTKLNLKEIADKFGIKYATIGAHKNTMFKELMVSTRYELILTAFKEGWITKEDIKL